jgi:hypothetical protein
MSANTNEIKVEIPQNMYGTVTIEIVDGQAMFVNVAPRLKVDNSQNNINIAKALKEIF